MRIFLVTLSLVFGFLASAEDAPEAIFFSANQAYDQADYESALGSYAKLLGTVESSELHHNIGNVYFRMGELGRSLFHFRRALSLNPRFSDAAYNLQYARNQTKDKIAPPTIPLFVSWLPLTLKELLWLTGGLSLVWLLLHCVPLLFAGRTVSWPRHLIGFSCLLLLVIFAVRVYFVPRVGVVQKETVQIYSGIGRDNVLLFTLNEGTEFELVEEREDWVQIRLTDGKRGWLKRSTVIF